MKPKIIKKQVYNIAPKPNLYLAVLEISKRENESLKLLIKGFRLAT